MSAAEPHPWALRLFGAAAVVGIVGWVILLCLWAWWMLQPANLPSVTEPMPVLNLNDEVAIGESLLLQLDVTKSQELTAVSTGRFIECPESGNLVTLTGLDAINLPTGSYTVVADSITLPPKVTVGDRCQAVIRVTYRINPVRVESVEFESELFTVMPAKEAP